MAASTSPRIALITPAGWNIHCHITAVTAVRITHGTSTLARRLVRRGIGGAPVALKLIFFV